MMKLMKYIRKNIFRELIIMLILSNSTVLASDSIKNPWYQIKDGLAIYIGLIPAEIIEGHTSHIMHGGVPVGQYRYHVAIAIFDNKTGKRIKNATVNVNINNRIGIGMESNKRLEDMKINGMFMYGNYFTLKTAGPYRIKVSINLGDGKKPTQVTFDYDLAQT